MFHVRVSASNVTVVQRVTFLTAATMISDALADISANHIMANRQALPIATFTLVLVIRKRLLISPFFLPFSHICKGRAEV